MLVHFTYLYASSAGSDVQAYLCSLTRPFATRNMLKWSMMNAKTKLCVFDCVPYGSFSRYNRFVCDLLSSQSILLISEFEMRGVREEGGEGQKLPFAKICKKKK